MTTCWYYNLIADYRVPRVTTYAVTAITETSAEGGGTVTDDGGLDITARGVAYGTSQYASTITVHTHDGIGIGAFASVFPDLTPGTKYYVRAYATNSKGTSYGKQVTFTTIATTTTTTSSSTTTTTTTAVPPAPPTTTTTSTVPVTTTTTTVPPTTTTTSSSSTTTSTTTVVPTTTTTTQPPTTTTTTTLLCGGLDFNGMGLTSVQVDAILNCHAAAGTTNETIDLRGNDLRTAASDADVITLVTNGCQILQDL